MFAGVLLTLSLSTAVAASDLSDALAQAQRGDYPNALRVFRLLAEKGVVCAGQRMNQEG